MYPQDVVDDRYGQEPHRRRPYRTRLVGDPQTLSSRAATGGEVAERHERHPVYAALMQSPSSADPPLAGEDSATVGRDPGAAGGDPGAAGGDPGAAGGGADGEGYLGERLGRPRGGPGSLARPGRRILGIAVDWVLCTLIARALRGGDPFAPLLVLAVEHLVLVGTLGASVGHRVAGLRVERLDHRLPGPARAAVRTLLLCLAIPALVWDADQRGLHDRLVGTLVVRG
jgi:hypothetical protein